jgi:hypothetical protein
MVAMANFMLANWKADGVKTWKSKNKDDVSTGDEQEMCTEEKERKK